MEIGQGQGKLTALSILTVLNRRSAGGDGSTLNVYKALSIRNFCLLIDLQWQGLEDQGCEPML